MKLDRLGLLWGASITLIYNIKKDIARVWNKDEAILIRKINDISMDMYKYIKKDINKHLNIIYLYIYLELSYNLMKTSSCSQLDYEEFLQRRSRRGFLGSF